MKCGRCSDHGSPVVNAFLTVPLAVSILIATSVRAATADADSTPGLEEVVVTATKRTETLISVPLSMTALSADTLERAQIESFQDYARLVPNVTFSSGVGIVDGRNIAVRGISGGSTTGFYIDDLPVPASLDPRVVDTERIEVLRGPQGTLFGARSMGGTIRMITTEPDTKTFSGKVTAEGSTLQAGTSGYMFSGTANIPLLDDRAALRLSAYTGRDGAFINRRWPDANDPNRINQRRVAGNDFTGFSGDGLVKFTDNLTVRVHALAQQSLLDGFPLSDFSPDTFTQNRTFNIQESARDRWIYTGLSVNYRMPLGTVTSATSYFNRKTFEVEDVSEFTAYSLGVPPLPTPTLDWSPSHIFTEEVRFASTFPGPVQFVGGYYYSRDTVGTFSQLINIPGLDAETGGALGTDLVFQEYLPAFNQESALFGELTYQIAPAWSAILGLRYSWLRESISDGRAGLAGGDGPTVYASQRQTAATPKVVIKYQPTPELDVYALASKGYRPGGGQSPPPVAFCGGDYSQRGLTPEDLQTYRSDSLWNYEVGTKAQLWEHELQLNTAFFWIDWKDIRQNARFDCGYNFIVNGGAARSRGAEIELAAAPVEHLTVNLGVGYTDAVITATTPTLLTLVGSPIQQIAPWTASFSADYSRSLIGNLKWFAHFDESYTDHSFSATNDPVQPRLRRGYTLTNARAGVTSGAWDLALFIENATNTRANIGDNGSEGGELPGRIRWMVNPPRRVGIQGIYRW